MQNSRRPLDTLRRKTIVRPTAEVLAGLVGPNARASWNELAASGDTERMNAVLRFLFAAFIIDEHQGKRGRFNYGRIDIEPNASKPGCTTTPWLRPENIQTRANNK